MVLLFTGYSSRFTVHGLLFTDYCWSQYKNCIVKDPVCNVAIQNSNLFILGLHYIAIQNSKCISTLNIPSVLYCNTISSNTKFQVVCFTTILQYNVAIQSFSFQAAIQSLLTIQYLQPTQALVTIQNIVLQYKQPSNLFLCNTKIVYCNTLYKLPALFISQYKWTLAIQLFFFHNISWAVAQKNGSALIFFFSFAIILK